MTLRFLSAALALLVVGASGSGAQDESALRGLATAYATYLSAGKLRDDCRVRDPASVKATDQAYASWLQDQQLQPFEAQLKARLGEATVSQLRTQLTPQLEKLVVSMRQLGSAAQVCAAYRSQLKGDTFDLRANVPRLQALLAPGGSGVSGSSSQATTPKTTTPPVTKAGTPTVRYSVAQLSSLAGQTLATLPASTQSSAAEQAVLTKLRALGSPLAVTGRVQRSRSLTQSDDRREVRWSVYCYDMANDADNPPQGQDVTVIGRVREVDRDTSITLEDCRVVQTTALKASTLPVADVAWRFKNQPAERFLVAAGKGLNDSAVLGVYTTQSSGIGVGGAVLITYPPALFLKDGTVYNDPYWAPNSFNVQLSRSLEPQKWGKWTRQGQNFKILWGDGKTEVFEVQDALKPSAKGLNLSGEYASLGGGGNTAFGGDVLVAAGSNYVFKPDGTFTGGRFAGASTPGAVVNSSSASAGRYTVQGYSLTLKPAQGTEQRLLFYRFGDALHIGGSDFVPN